MVTTGQLSATPAGTRWIEPWMNPNSTNPLERLLRSSPRTRCRCNGDQRCLWRHGEPAENLAFEGAPRSRPPQGQAPIEQRAEDRKQPVGHSARNCTESVPTECTKTARVRWSFPYKFSAVPNSARHSCAPVAASWAIPDNRGIKGLRTRPKRRQEWPGVPKSRGPSAPLMRELCGRRRGELTRGS
jgi:hypothetical protein